MRNGLGKLLLPGAVSLPSSHQLTCSPLLERQIVVVRRRRLVEWRAIPGRRRLAHGGRRASCDRRRIGARGAVARRPDDPFATRPAALARLVPTLEVRRPRVPLRRAVVPHRAAADGAEGHPVVVHPSTSRTRARRATVPAAAGAARCFPAQPDGALGAVAVAPRGGQITPPQPGSLHLKSGAFGFRFPSRLSHIGPSHLGQVGTEGAASGVGG